MLKVILALLLIIVNLHADDHSYQVVDLLFFGAFGMIIIYNLAHYLMSKDTAYASYFVFHLFLFVIMLFFVGIFDDSLLDFTIHGVSVAWFFLAVASLLAFTRDFLDLEKTVPALVRFINALIIINLGLMFLSVFAYSNIYLENLVVGFIILIAVGLLALSGYLSIKYKHVYAKFYFVAFSFLFIAVVAVFLTQFKLLYLNDYAILLFELGILFEASVFSFALAHQHEDSLVKLKQNELLFKELSHRVQNNLQQIISILTLHMGSVKEEEVKEHLQDTINRIGSISLIHKTLQNSKNVGKVNLHAYLDSVLHGYKAMHPTVAFSFECDKGIILEIEKLTPLALILNELITNSLKHAFDAISSPTIHCEIKEDKAIEFQYTDNGSGFDPENAMPSLGTKLITILSRNQLKGTVDIDSNDQYTFTLTFWR